MPSPHTPRFHSTPSFPSPPCLPYPSSRGKDGEWGGLQSIQNSSSQPLVPPYTIPLQEHGRSVGHSSFRRYPEAQAWHPPQAAVWTSALAWSSPRAAGKYQLHHGLSNSCSGTSAPAFGAPLHTPSLTLVVCKAVFHTFFPYSLPYMWHVFPLHNHAFPEVPHPRLISSAVPWVSLLELFGTSCVWYGTAPGLLTQRPPCSTWTCTHEPSRESRRIKGWLDLSFCFFCSLADVTDSTHKC